MRFVYTAHERATLAPGHVVGDDYEIIVGARAYIMEHSRKGRLSTSIDGTREYNLHHIKRRWNVTTTKIAEGTALLEWEEFLDSVAGEELVVWDREGNAVGVDVNPLTVKVISTRHLQRRVMRTPNYRFNLQLEEV